MRIVCLAWGSLVWKPGALPVASAWFAGGPRLPIEFARVGDKGELATTLCPGQPLSPSRWARLGETRLAAACASLRAREEIDPERADGIGSVVVGEAPGAWPGAAVILDWAGVTGEIDAVVWTALPPRFAGVEGRVPSPAEAAAYLLGLRGERRLHAEDYVRRTPEEIRTANRRALEQALSA